MPAPDPGCARGELGRALAEGAGFRVDAMGTRAPHDVEYPTRRLYTVATRP
jgi:hypothetical protein